MVFRAIIIRIAVVLVAVVVVVVGWGFFFYRGFLPPPVVEKPSYEQVTVPSAPTTEFSDNYTQGEGVILVDLAHDNNFESEELNVLFLRLVSRGLKVKFFTVKDDLKKVLLAEEDKEKKEAIPAGVDEKKDEEKEPLADAYIIIAPWREFSKEDKKTIDKFVEKGGKLLLMADPTRRSEINSLALQFGLIFESDYLYNTKENEINYRNIFVTEFKENDITKELRKIALYTAGSISSDNASIAFVDENTFSSVVETREKLAPLALAQEGKVLAIYDLTFMIEPHNGVLDNNRLISNIADWLIPPTPKTKAK